MIFHFWHYVVIMDKEKKNITVDNLKDSFENAESVILTHYLGLNTSELTELRSNVKKAGARFCVAKNSLAKIASKNTAYEGLKEFFSGPIAIIFSKDPVSGIKAVKNYSDDNEKLKFIKASLNDKLIDNDEFVSLSKLPSLEEVRTEIVGYLLAPQQQIVQILNAAGSELVSVLDNYAKKNN